MNFKGVIIEESLRNFTLPLGVKILSSEVERVTDQHKTPWLKQWTLQNVEVDESMAEDVAEKISNLIETEHSAWYADFKNGKLHYVIFPHKVFKVEAGHENEYQKVRDYGSSLGIPDYQMQFEELER